MVADHAPAEGAPIVIERAMVVAAHPDDAETGAGGTVAVLVRQGVEVTYVIVTKGNAGSQDRAMTADRLGSIRAAEQYRAAKTLGVTHVEFLGYADGEVEDTRDLRRDITRQIRRWRPNLVISQNPHRTRSLFASHRDHRITGGVVLDCVYPLARNHMAFPELLPDYEPHKVGEIYIIKWPEDDHDLAVDISETMEVKLKAIACHESQFLDFPKMEGYVRARCAALGKPYGHSYAEVFDRILLSRWGCHGPRGS